MATLIRFYIDKRILDEPDENGLLGGDHSRMIDVGEADADGEPDPAKALERVKEMLEADEVIGSTASLSVDYPEELEVEWI